LILFVYLTGLLLLLPTLPTLLTNDFASRKNGGERLRCEDYLPKEEPTPCRDAHAAVVWAATWSGFFQNTIFAVTLTPALGAWSDVHGRKPFLLLAMALSCGPLVVVLLNLHIGLPLYYYYAVNAFTGSITSVAPALAYVADVIPPQLRAAAFGFIMASFRYVKT
jgi:MFS family permease